MERRRMNEIERALEKATDTRACVIGAGATECAAKMFRGLFPEAKRAVVVSDPRTRKVAAGAFGTSFRKRRSLGGLSRVGACHSKQTKAACDE